MPGTQLASLDRAFADYPLELLHELESDATSNWPLRITRLELQHPATPASGSSLSGGEATPWVTLRSLAELCDDLDTVIWWGCQDDGQARSRLWSPLTAPPSERKKTVLAPDCRWGRSCRHWPSRSATPINGLPATV